MKVLFFGTPQIAVPYLEWLHSHTTVVGVVCRPDEPVGRGLTLTPPPTKRFAVDKGIPVYQPVGPWKPEELSLFRELGADIGVAVAYGRLLPETILNAPRHGCINIHFSLLPKYRGAAPMQWALIKGETKTGVTAFWLDKGMDEGPIFHQQELSIRPEDDAASLREKLVPLGIAVLDHVVADIEHDRIRRVAQQGTPSFAPILKKEMGRIDWSEPAQKIVNLVRGLCEWPGTVTRYASSDNPTALKNVKILKAALEPGGAGKEPGTIVDVKKNQGPVVQTKDGRVLLLQVQPEGKAAMPAWAFWQGARLTIGDKLI